MGREGDPVTVKIVPPFDHDHNVRPECGEHNRRDSQGNTKQGGRSGKHGHPLPLDKAQVAAKVALDKASQANVPTLVVTNGKARFVR
jgi:hypothetical protein